MHPPTTPPTGDYHPDALDARWRPWWESLALHAPAPTLSPDTLNHLWRASKFVLMHIEPWQPHPWELDALRLAPADRWILHRFDALLASLSTAATQAERLADLERWLRRDWCTWYIELSKPVLYETEALAPLGGEVASSRAVLAHMTGWVMRLIAPYAPQLAEAIWQNLPAPCRAPWVSVLLASSPSPVTTGRFDASSRAVELLIEVLSALLAIRRDAGLGQLEHIPRVATRVTEEQRAALSGLLPYIHSIARPRDLTLTTGEGEKEPPGARRAETPSGVGLVVELVELDALERDAARLRRELGEVEEAMGYVRARLENPLFLERAPADVVANERERYSDLRDRQDALQEELEGVDAWIHARA